MISPEPEWLLSSWVRLVRSRWAATGVSRADREMLLYRLHQDLTLARAEGATINELVATSPEDFADSCAAGLMSRSAGVDVLSLIAVCLGSGIVATGVAWTALNLGVRILADSTILDAAWFTLSVDLALALAVLATMVGAVRWAFRVQPDTALLVPRLAITLVAGSLLGFAAASAYGAAWGYSVRPDVVGFEAAIMLAALVLATILAQHWARHRPRQAGHRISTT